VPLLEVEDVTVRFGGHVAVDHVSLDVDAGAITGLIGPNGAGKTTMFNVLCGLQKAVRGRVVLDGEDLTGQPPYRRARRGLARTFQRLETFSLLSVRENVLAGAEFRRKWSADDTGVEAVADELISKLGLDDVADERVDALPTGRARLVEVARALSSRPRVLLLDEPSSGLNEAETEELAVVLRELAADGLAVLMVEHDMSLVMGTCSTIHVLDFGQIIAVGDPEEIQADGRVQAAYLGTEQEEEIQAAERALIPDRPPDPRDALAPFLTVREVCAGYGEFDVVTGVEFTLDTGEVFALLGPNGAGKTTVLRVISGLLTPSSGEVELCGRSVVGADADELARAGLCMIPEGRGIFPNLSVRENLLMTTLTGTSMAEVEEIAYERFPRLGERRTQTAGTLSGGEQQMLAMARALTTDPALLILDELSMGLAPIVVSELYDEVARIAAGGLSILVVEQFAHEVLGVADRAAIMVHGRITRTGAPDEIADDLAAAYLAGAD
jgi:ABC-type branched-subunit amino acid transport system ATPase component